MITMINKELLINEIKNKLANISDYRNKEKYLDYDINTHMEGEEEAYQDLLEEIENGKYDIKEE
jgi:hypothetical protein